MSNQVVEVRRETIAACMTCPLCNKLFRDATTISECLHTFCRKCIYKKLSDEELECCPICNIDLGCVPLEKLRPDHNLQDVRAKIFPFKRRKVKAPEVAPSATLPVRRKERSLSSLVVSTPRVSTQTAMTGRRSKAVARKTSALRGSSFPIERSVKKEEDSVEDRPESSSSPETLNKFTQNMRQNSSNAEASSRREPEKETENCAETWEGKIDLWKPLNCLVEVANRSKSSKYTSQGSAAKSEPLHAPDPEGHIRKRKVKEHGTKSRVQDKKDSSDRVSPDSAKPKKLRRIRHKKAAASGELGISPQAVLDAASAKGERRIGPIWFSLVASEDQKGHAPLPQISASYLRIKNYKASDGNYKDSVEVALAGNRFLQQYLATQVKDICSQKPSIQHWTPPPNGTYKVNFDGAFIPKENIAGVGIIVRDERGRPIASMVERLGAVSDADHVLACAARVGLKFARDLGLQEVIMEGDSQSVINALNLRSPDLCQLIEDMLRFSLYFRSCEWKHVLRGGNKAAHALAVHAVTIDEFLVWMEEVPDFVLPIIQQDCNLSV